LVEVCGGAPDEDTAARIGLSSKPAPPRRSRCVPRGAQRLGRGLMGDVKGVPSFTHLSCDDHRILHANLIKHQKVSTRDRVVRYAVFIDPRLGRTGLTEREARAQGRSIRMAKLPMSAVIRAIETGETRGFMKAVVDADRRQILGCAVLGSEGGEIMTMIQIAMLGKLTYTAAPLDGRLAFETVEQAVETNLERSFGYMLFVATPKPGQGGECIRRQMRERLVASTDCGEAERIGEEEPERME
jgi:hypothetical protein